MPLPLEVDCNGGEVLKPENIPVAVQQVILHKALPKYWSVVSGVSTLWRRC